MFTNSHPDISLTLNTWCWGFHPQGAQVGESVCQLSHMPSLILSSINSQLLVKIQLIVQTAIKKITSFVLSRQILHLTISLYSPSSCWSLSVSEESSSCALRCEKFLLATSRSFSTLFLANLVPKRQKAP